MDTDTLWQVGLVAAITLAVALASGLAAWAFYRAGRDDEARAREDHEKWWDANVRRRPGDEEPPPPAPAIASVTPLPRRQPGPHTVAGGWTPPAKHSRGVVEHTVVPADVPEPLLYEFQQANPGPGDRFATVVLNDTVAARAVVADEAAAELDVDEDAPAREPAP